MTSVQWVWDSIFCRGTVRNSEKRWARNRIKYRNKNPWPSIIAGVAVGIDNGWFLKWITGRVENGTSFHIDNMEAKTDFATVVNNTVHLTPALASRNVSCSSNGGEKLNKRLGKFSKTNNEEGMFAEPKGHSLKKKIEWESKWFNP